MVSNEIEITAVDATAQRRGRLSLPRDASIDELIDASRQRLGLPERDAEGRPLTYYGRSESLGRQLFSAEKLGDVFEHRGADQHAEAETVRIQPEIAAGQGNS